MINFTNLLINRVALVIAAISAIAIASISAIANSAIFGLYRLLCKT